MSMPLDTSVDIALPPPPLTRPTRPFYWSVRRELWENRSIYVGPLAAAAVVLFGFMLGLVHLNHMHVVGLDGKQSLGPSLPYDMAAAAVCLTSVLVSVFFCLGSLYSERRDRSILFWKSLPVSDLTTVLSKSVVPIAIVPVVAFATIIVTWTIMLIASSAALVANGVGVAMLWTQLPIVQMAVSLLYFLIALALWHAPIYGWLLLVSSWAKRAAFLWAVLPPLALCIIERLAIGTNYFPTLLAHRLGKGIGQAFAIGAFDHEEPSAGITDPLSLLDPLKFLSSPDLWIGLAVAAAFVAAAIRMRRYREPI